MGFDYINKFREITGINEQILSTVDHVYASIPIRLIDSHHILYKMRGVKILIWDDIYPKIKKYQSELIIDSGIFAANKPEYFLFPQDMIYGLSQVAIPNLDKQKRELENCLNLTLKNSKDKKPSLIQTYLKRFDDILSLYRKVFSKEKNSSNFYKNLVVEIYKFLGFKEVADFYNNSAQSFMSSGIIDKYLPWLLEETKNEVFGLKYLVKNSSLFPSPHFRYVNNYKGVDFFKTDGDMEEIIRLFKNGKLLPSKEVMYWVFAISEIKHFGMDFGFFSKLEEYFKSKLGIENRFSEQQLTAGKDDGVFYIQFEKDTSYRLVYMNDKVKAQRFPIPKKSTDISTIPSIYLHIGNKFKEFYEKYNKSGEIFYIKMGEISI